MCVCVCGCEPVHGAAYGVHLCAQDGLAACEVGLWVHIITAVWRIGDPQKGDSLDL